MSFMVALLPPPEAAQLYAQMAKQHFSHCEFHLSNSSLPHVTLCQLEATLQQAQTLWQTLSSRLPPSLSLRPIGISVIQGIGPYASSNWVELALARDPELMRAHKSILEAAAAHSLPCLNDCGDLYRPHLTLARTQLPLTLPAWPKNLLKSAPFKLDLIECLAPEARPSS